MNNSWARKTVQTGAIAAGAVLVAGGTAHAATDAETSDQIGAVSGNQVVAPVQAPINICGVAASVLGTAGAGCEGGASAENDGHGADLDSHDNVGLANGNQAYAPIQVPAEVSGVAASVAGISGAESEGGSEAELTESGHVTEAGGADADTHGNTGLLNGNQLLAPIQAPINVCGNAVAILGVAGADCEGGADAKAENGSAADLDSHHNTGLINGNQVFAPIQAPINVCGNAVAILGVAGADCEGGADAEVEVPDESHKNPGNPESATSEAADVDVNEEQLPVDPADAVDTVTGATDEVTGDLPVVGDLTEGLTADDALDGASELTGAGLL